MVVRLVKDWDKEDDLLQQTPAYSGKWDGIEFTLDPVDKCDVIVFLNRIKEDVTVTCRRGGRWLLQMEPPTPAHAWYRKSDSQVDLVMGPAKAKSRAVYHKTHGALPWHLNKGYDFLKSLEPNPDQQERVSMITSNANWMTGHELRHQIVKMQQKGFLNFDLFGRGYNPIEDKFDALYPYPYSIVIENSFYPNYWTEKIADCLLSWTVPIYIGASNIQQFFPEKAVISAAPDVDALKAVIKSLDYSDYSERIEAIGEARQKILGQYQLFPFLAKRLLNASLEKNPHETYQLKGNKAPWEGAPIPLRRKLEYRWRKFLSKRPY